MTLANSTKNKMISKLLLFSPVHFPATFVIREKKKKVMVSVVRSFSLSNSDNNQQTYKTLQQRVTCEREIKRSKFIGIAAPICNEESVHSFLSEVRDPRATHNCWAYKLGDQYRSNDDGEPSGTAGKPIYSAIASSGIDRVMVVVIRHFGGIKLGTGGLVRAYGGVASECLRDALTCVVKPKVSISLEVPFDLLGSVYHQLQSSQVEDMKQDFDSGEGSIPMLTFRVDYDRVESLENVIKANCSRDIVFLRHQQGSSVSSKKL